MQNYLSDSCKLLDIQMLAEITGSTKDVGLTRPQIIENGEKFVWREPVTTRITLYSQRTSRRNQFWKAASERDRHKVSLSQFKRSQRRTLALFASVHTSEKKRAMKIKAVSWVEWPIVLFQDRLYLAPWVAKGVEPNRIDRTGINSTPLIARHDPKPLWHRDPFAAFLHPGKRGLWRGGNITFQELSVVVRNLLALPVFTQDLGYPRGPEG